MYLYSPATRGFYVAAIHGDKVPGDAVPVSAETHAGLMAAQGNGMVIVPGPDGAPVALAPPPPPPPPPIRRIRARAFRHRMSPATRAAVTLAASTDMEGGGPGADAQVFLDDIAASQVINLDAGWLTAGVARLLAAGLITAAERDALLADGTPAETND